MQLASISINWHQLAISIKVLHALSCLSNCMEPRWFLLPPPCRTSGVASTKKRLGLRWSVCPTKTCRNMSKLPLLAADTSAICFGNKGLGCKSTVCGFLLHVSIIAILWKMSRTCHEGRQMSWPTLQTAKRGSWPLAGRHTSPSGLHRYYHCTYIYIYIIYILSYILYI